MSAPWFASICALVEDATGVELDADKQFLAESRLTPLLSQFDIDNLANLTIMASRRKTPGLTEAVIQAMMTGETFFFRDIGLFKYMREILLPTLIEKNADRKSLRILSAACSTGQEAYSLAMMLDEVSKTLPGWDVEIVANDVSASAVQRARTGSYNQFEVQRGLPVTNLLAYFERHEDHWRINAKMRDKIEFRTSNLIDSRNREELFDLILCRNVLMYFSPENRRTALENVDQQLVKGGYLIVGSSEAGIAQCGSYSNVPENPAILRKNGQRQHASSESNQNRFRAANA